MCRRGEKLPRGPMGEKPVKIGGKSSRKRARWHDSSNIHELRYQECPKPLVFAIGVICCTFWLQAEKRIFDVFRETAAHEKRHVWRNKTGPLFVQNVAERVSQGTLWMAMKIRFQPADHFIWNILRLPMFLKFIHDLQSWNCIEKRFATFCQPKMSSLGRPSRPRWFWGKIVEMARE